MKFDYRGILTKIKNTLEQTYAKSNCSSDFFVMMLVVDTRIESENKDDFLYNDLVKIISTDRKYGMTGDLLISSYHKNKDADKYKVKEIVKAFKLHSNECGDAIVSDLYSIYDFDEFDSDSAFAGMVEADDKYLRATISVCAKKESKYSDGFLVKQFSGFNSTFHELITREYLKHFVSGVVNTVITQSTSLPNNIVSQAGVKYLGYWNKMLTQNVGYGKFDEFASSINRISELAYESRQASGKIVFCDSEFPDKYTLLKFKTPYQLGNSKLVRKLLQIVDKGNCLAATGESIYGIVSEEHVMSYRTYVEKLFCVEFVKERIWSLSYIGNLLPSKSTIFESAYENYRYAKISLDSAEIKKAFKSLEITADIDTIVDIIKAATNSMGTMIVFNQDAEAESERLKRTGILLKTPINLGSGEAKDLVNFITSIDGAIMCDENGVCYAIGVILDGFTSSAEDSFEDISRGARHNSAYRYISGNKGKCVIAVISEDGDVSIIH